VGLLLCVLHPFAGRVARRTFLPSWAQVAVSASDAGLCWLGGAALTPELKEALDKFVTSNKVVSS